LTAYEQEWYQEGTPRKSRRVNIIAGLSVAVIMKITLHMFAAGLVVIIPLLLACEKGNAEVLSQQLADSLKTTQYIYVATRRTNGQWSTAAPVWFMYEEGKVYFTTAPSSHKAYRIHRGSPVKIWVGTKDGPFFEGTAELVKDPDLTNRMGAVYSEKYWVAWLGLFRPRPARVGSGKTLVVRVTPMPREQDPVVPFPPSRESQ
jgi:general stress protein 26